MGVGMRHVPSACVAMQVANEMTKVLVAAGKLDMQTRRSWPRQVSTFSFSLDQLCFVLYRTSHESRRQDTAFVRHCMHPYLPQTNALARTHLRHHMVRCSVQMDSVFVPPETHSTEDACPGKSRHAHTLLLRRLNRRWMTTWAAPDKDRVSTHA